MKLYFENSDALQAGIEILAEDLGFAVAADPREACVTVETQAVDEDILKLSLKGNRAKITYGGGKARFFRGLGFLVDWLRDDVSERELTEAPLFRSNGAMVDMSRNAVMNVKTVKFMMRKMALMGMNSFMLYTEDTYEIENRPYFGYMRGRYTKEEIRELDAYALTLGIELIPCIQVLGHLATMLRWSAAGAYKDTSGVLLVGAEKTYALIDDMLRTASECFTTRKIHIGMDETHDLGTGKYLDQFGYRERREIYFEHLGRVAKMAQAYGLEPMMWSDMFFRMSAKGISGYSDYDRRVVLPEDIGQYVPQGVRQVFWDYYHPEEEFYAENIEKHKLLGKDTVFAGGVWTWSGHCPHFSRSKRHTVPALDACRKGGIRDVLATVWHNGSEACLIMALAGLAWYADYDYKGGFDEESVKVCFKAACGQSYDDFMKSELPEYPHGGMAGISRSLVYNDPLIGLIDRHVEGLDTKAYYTGVKEQLANAGSGIFTPAFDVIRALTDLLIHKADFGVRLKKAYDTADRETMAKMAEECDVIAEKIGALRKSHRAAWMTYNKPFGWEVHDIRYGGLSMRFETAKDRISAYLAGEIEHIEELEAERLRFDGQPDDAPITSRFVWYKYQAITTASIL